MLCSIAETILNLSSLVNAFLLTVDLLKIVEQNALILILHCTLAVYFNGELAWH